MNTGFELTFLNFSIQRETAVSRTPEVPPEQEEKSFVKCTKRGKGDAILTFQLILDYATSLTIKPSHVPIIPLTLCFFPTAVICTSPIEASTKHEPNSVTGPRKGILSQVLKQFTYHLCQVFGRQGEKHALEQLGFV